MKQLITCFLLLFLPEFTINAQVCPPKPAANTGCETDTSSVYLPEPDPNPYIDLNNLDRLVEKKPKRVVQFGYGITSVLRMDQHPDGRSVSNDLSWFNVRPTHVFDLSFGMGSRSEWLLGFSFGFQELGEINRSETYLPEDYVQEQANFGALPLELKYQFKARRYAPLIYTEYRILRPWKGFSAFGRVEMGMTMYQESSQLSYRDSCNCEQIPVSDWNISTAFTAGLGVGVKWEYKWIGLKALVAYQVQTKVNFKEREAYAAYSFDFDPVGYDFRGGPEKNRFVLEKSGEAISRGYNPLYLQLMIYFRFGSK